MKYPESKAHPIPVTHGRVTYTDSYQWLEEESSEALEWQSLQDGLTQGWLRSRPTRARAEALVDAVPRFTGSFPSCAGGRWFRKYIPAGQNLEVIEVAEDIKGPWRILVDLNQMVRDEPLAFANVVPSPDGKKLLFGWGVGGREMPELRIIEVDSGKILLEKIRQIRPCLPAWFSDSTGIYYTAANPQSPAIFNIYRQVLGEEPVVEPEAYEASHSMTWARSADDNSHFFVMADHLNPRPDYIRKEGGTWRPFLKGESASFRGGVIGDHYYAITDDGAKCGRVVSIPLATPKDRSTWREVVAGSDDVLAALHVVAGKLLLLDLVDTYSRMRVFDPDGALSGEISLPGRGAVCTSNMVLFSVMDTISKGNNGDVLFPFSSLVQFPSLYKANVLTLKVEELVGPRIRLDATVHDFGTISADGMRAPYRVVARSDLALTRPHPTVIYGYGGFACALLPGWLNSLLAAWVQGGGVLVLAHLRGGGELGPIQWHSGRLKNKQNTFNDAHAIAEDLIARGITTSAQLGVMGASNGGVMAAVAIVQRPELFRASIAQVPLTDILGCMRDPVTFSISLLDYGDPRDPEMSEVLHAWSPYQNVKDGTAYPAILLDAGKNDPRCPPWHVRKMAARMQRANAGDNPILMRVREGAGHGSVGQADQRALDIDFLNFFMDQLGLEAQQ